MAAEITPTGAGGRRGGPEPAAVRRRATRRATEPGGEPMAMADLDRPWELDDPRRDRTLHPYTDADTAAIVDQAVSALVVVRAPMWLGDPGPTLSALVSLAGEAGGQVDDAVADAVDQGYCWDQIASRLATTVSAARRRHAGYVEWRRRGLLGG